MTKGDKPQDASQAIQDVFDIERIRTIIELMEQHELAEVDLQQGDQRIKLGRGVTGAVAAPAPPPAAVPVPHATPAAPPADDPSTITIKAPMVGTFYAKPKPDAATFVKVGDRVNEDTVVCIVEAMKVFNEIPAECSGEVVEILVSDQQPVDFGKPLFRVRVDA